MFSGFLREIYEFNIEDALRITAGDVLFNLFITANEIDLPKLVNELGQGGRIFDMLNNSYLGLLGWLCKIIGEAYLTTLTEESRDAKFLAAIEKGHFIFFDGSFLGNHQIEKLEVDSKKISLKIEESLIYSHPQLALVKSFTDKHLANDARNLTFERKSYDPLDLIILVPTADTESKLIGKLEKGAAYLFPACIVYALFRQDTYEALKIFGELTLQIALCFVGAGQVTAAMRVGNLLGVFAGIADISLGAFGATINTIPEISRNHPDFVKYTNYALIIYCLARLGYAAYKSNKIGTLSEEETASIFRRIALSKRGTTALTNAQKAEISAYLKLYDLPDDFNVIFRELEVSNTAYGNLFGIEVLYIGPDVMPIENAAIANSRLSWKAAIAHELEGHRVAAINNKTIFGNEVKNVLEEVQASVRASKFGKGLSQIERNDLWEDAMDRLKKINKNYEQIKDELWLEEL